jgi:cell division septation protein DedD
MNKLQNPFLLALLLIAACATSTAAWAQKVYRCGATYSQTPCQDAVALDTDDARSKAQKTQADQATARDVKTANTLEQARLKEEKEAAIRSQPVSQGRKSSKAAPQTKTDASAPKKAKKKKEPELFTATAASEKKPAPSKLGN